MLISEVIQRVQNLYSKGVPSKDSRLSKRHIYSKLLTVRSRLLSQKVNKKQRLSQWSYQTLPCIKLIKAPLYECPCIPTGNCYILRTEERIPTIVTSLNKDIIQSVTTIDGSVIFDSTSFEIEKYSKGNKYTSTKSQYYIKGGYLYITHIKLLEVITITGVFEDPTLIEKYPSYCKDCEDCLPECKSTLDLIFPIDSDLIEPLLEISSQELVSVFLGIKEDTKNDAKNEIQQPRE